MSDDSVAGGDKIEGERLEPNSNGNGIKEEGVKTVATTLADIEESLDALNLSFNLDALNILDDDYAKPREIEALREKLGTSVPVRLFGLANSAHYGRASSGKITRFTDVISRLGTDLTRYTAIFIAFLELSTSEDMKLVMARNFATSKMSQAIALHLDAPASKKNMAVFAGLFLEIGRLIILLFAYKEGIKFKDEFLDKYQARIGGLVIDKFGLPAELREIIQHPCFTFEGKDCFTSSAISDMAHSIVDASFRNHGKLLVQSAMPDPEGILYNSTIGLEIQTQFTAMGLGKYVRVISAEPTEAEQRLLDKGMRR
jgi:hypothetical protein